MGYRATVETNTGDRLRLFLADGRIGGNALFTFLEAMYSVYSESNIAQTTDLQEWVTHLEDLHRLSMHNVTRPIISSYYTGDWTYTEDEYILFQLRSPALSISEIEFKTAIGQVEKKWTSIAVVRPRVNELLDILPQRTEATWWYHPQYTTEDLRALEQNLLLAEKRFAEEFRIQFT
ncbi:MAG: hypothetical protein HC893_07625 [Chloroflexaceae bacterium]|nr:hypothetical protein [Chloroflexaceae bacterium]NJL55189.1 hypothetical protein [bacterium]